ncbi:hybrid sensor histidine kinase/response regulator [Planctomicrobium piriforme]|uniref:histidine kinase n=1 Tax=Planctomicrobium piriforme TaxID=1576369 RepID=A0A1I3B3X0_9PLAN|nr:ATP-binding protein [Planctomicrobium piriforme]SFH56987.1 hypothetical protein SAMN05421753_101219 [Planctomicrobium piriforme]
METPLPQRILIVEDDFDTCDNLRDILELDQHVVDFANTAQQALQSEALTHATIILLDWKLPDATAMQVLPRLTEKAPEADVIIITGHGDFDHAVSALRQGAADYLLKPINPEVLRNSLQRLAHRRWLAREKNRSDAKFRNLVQAAPCLIVILRQDLSIAYFSPFGESLTGYPAAEILNRHFLDVFYPHSLASAPESTPEEVFDRVTHGEQGSQVACRQGTRRWIAWKTRQLEDVDGGAGILAVGQDVTESRHSTERLVQSERLAAIGEAMTGLAHESRNALQRSQAFLELLTVEVAELPHALRLVDRIQEAQNHLHQLYEEVRQYAAPIRLEQHPYVLGELIQETWAYLEHARQSRDARLLVLDSARDCTVEVDRFQLQQVFRNILENSLAACTDPVEICCNCEKRVNTVGDPVWQFSIKDNGPGLNPEQRERIFDPFFTTKTRGTGLGMTLCKRIVEAHGGRIAVGDGPGTEIVITLPCQRC